MELRESLRAVFGLERVAVWLLAAVAVAVVVLAVGATGAGLFEPPSAAFDGSYDADANTVTITHTGGDSLTPGQVRVVVTNASGTSSANLTWTDDDGDRLSVGADVTIDDPTADADGDGNYFDADRTVGFPLTPGAILEVRWTGRPLGASGERTVTLDTYEVGAN
jgi:hypothetical protein